MKIKSQRMIYFKIGFILLLILLLLIPNGILRSLIWERQSLAEQSKERIAESWGSSQKVNGPLISIPYYIDETYQDGNTHRTKGYYHILPETQDINGNLTPEIKKSGIYEAIVYEADLSIKGSFNLEQIDNIKDEKAVIEYDKAILSASVKDVNGISKEITGTWQDSEFKFEKGTPISNIFYKGGFHHKVDLSDDNEIWNYQFDIGLKGTENMSFTPYAANTNINLNSSWPSPRFIGRSPKSEISNEGFTCNWILNEHNRTLPAAFQNDNAKLIGQKSFGVDLIHGVDHYQKNMRSAKYAMLIITLTFMVFFFFEIMYKNKIHPIQYSLIGLALSLFYYLLLSFSEHIPFSYSYLIAAFGTISMISLYGLSVMEKKNSLFILFAILVGLYTYIFVLLQLEDFALIAGSIGLFVILSTVMYLSRNMNWYDIGIQDKRTGPDLSVDINS